MSEIDDVQDFVDAAAPELYRPGEAARNCFDAETSKLTRALARVEKLRAAIKDGATSYDASQALLADDLDSKEG